MSEMLQIERTLAAVAQRPSNETAKDAVRFFTACLEQRGYPKDQAAELLSLVSLIDYLLIIHSVEHGFFRLQTPDMQVTLQPSYDVLNAEEDLSVPSLGLLDSLPADAPITFTIARNAAVPVDTNTLTQLDKSGRRRALDVRIEVVGQGKPAPEAKSMARPEPEPAPLPQDPIGQAKRIVEYLGLSVDFFAKNARLLLENTRLWREEEALLALTIVFKNVRIIVGRIAPNQPIDVSKLKAYLQRAGMQEYTLGVFLVPPATPPTHPEHWKQDNNQNLYNDVPLGSISQEELEKADHLLLQ